MPQSVPGLSGAVEIAAGESDTCARTADGAAQCWGLDSHGELGTGAQAACYEFGVEEWPNRPAACTLTPTPVSQAAGVREIATGGSHLCALDGQRQHRCWGRNSSGELGDGSTVSETIVVTGPRPHAATATATLEGVVNPGGQTVTECAFQYGPGTNLDHSVPCANLPGSGGEPQAVEAGVTGLLPGTAYSYRLVVTADSKLISGAPDTFTTEPAASKTLPVLGRCEPSPPGSGDFEAAGCTAAQPGGPFTWSPWPLPRPHFTATIKKLRLETTSRGRITCAAGTLAGEYTGPQAAVAELTLTGCQATRIATGACRTSGAAAGEVRSLPLAATLGAVSETPTPTLGWELGGAGGEAIASLECGPTTVTVFGSAVGVITPVDAMSAKYKLTFAGKHGLQRPEGFLSGGRVAMSLRTAAGEQAAGMNAKLALIGEEPIELKALP